MKIIIPSQVIPTKKSINAVNIVQFLIIKELIKKKHQILLQPIFYANNYKKDKSFTKENIDKLKSLGVKILPILNLKIIHKKRNIFFRIFFSKNSDYFPVINLTKEVSTFFEKLNPDLIFTIWDELTTDLICNIRIKKWSFYGDAPPLNFNAILNRKIDSVNFLLRMILKFIYFLYKKNYKKFHLENISKIENLFDISKLDTDFYIKNKISCKYVNNIFLNSYSLKKIQSLKKKKNRIFKIIGNVGNLAGTANNLGIEYLLKEVLPKLKKKNFSFEIHLFGSGELSTKNLRLSKLYKEVLVRGFIKNIHYEICTSDVFLCCNNATSYNVGHTRFLHAFSLATCLVGHKRITEVMPEIISNKNCLLGESSDEIANILYSLKKDRIRSCKIGYNGYETFKNQFSSSSAVNYMLNQIKKMN